MLEGRPGVKTRRYAGEDPTDEENNTKLLGELSLVLNWQPKCLGLPISSAPGDLLVVLSQQPKELGLPASVIAILAWRVRRRGAPTQVLRPLTPATRVAQSADQ